MVLILVGIRLKDSRSIIFIGKFEIAMVMMDLMTIAQFFEAIYTCTFKRFLVAESINWRVCSELYKDSNAIASKS